LKSNQLNFKDESQMKFLAVESLDIGNLKKELAAFKSEYADAKRTFDEIYDKTIMNKEMLLQGKILKLILE